jgi:hypothetical protein
LCIWLRGGSLVHKVFEPHIDRVITAREQDAYSAKVMGVASTHHHCYQTHSPGRLI